MELSDICPSLRDAGRTAPVYYEKCVDSTNLALRRIAEDAADGTAVFASCQSAGRGRRGRSFLSPEGGLYLSMLLRPDGEVGRVASLAPVAAMAVCRAIDAFCGTRCGVKWPNDVVLGGRKICGILCESIAGRGSPCVIVGVGINVNTASFPEELRDIASSLALLTGREYDIPALASELVRQLDDCFAAWRGDEGFCLGEYRRRCVNVGRDVLVGDQPGFAQAIGEDYSLIVAYPDGSGEALRSGEVSVRGLYGYV